MNADLEHLVVLQAIDLEARRLKDELAALPGQLQKLEGAEASANTALQKLIAALDREEAQRRRQASDAQDHRTRLARLRRQMETAASTAQVVALQHEIDFAEAAIRSLEDEEFGSLERTEALEADRAAAEQQLQAAAMAHAAEKTRQAERKRTGTAALAARDAERKTLRPLIAEALLATYDRVSGSRGTGIAEAREGQCSACRMKVRPQRWADLAGRDHENEVFTCESCGRILFHDPRRHTPGVWPAGDRLAAALNPVPTQSVPVSEARV